MPLPSLVTVPFDPSRPIIVLDEHLQGTTRLSFLRNFRFCLDFQRGLLELYSS
jgi:hypothetical protein